MRNPQFYVSGKRPICESLQRRQLEQFIEKKPLRIILDGFTPYSAACRKPIWAMKHSQLILVCKESHEYHSLIVCKHRSHASMGASLRAKDTLPSLREVITPSTSSSPEVLKLSSSTMLKVSEHNTLRPRQNGRHFPDNIFKCIFLKENV